MEGDCLIKEKIEAVSRNALVEIYKWWGHSSPGASGYIITKTKELYEYNYYNGFIPRELEGKSTNYLLKRKNLNEDEYNRILLFVNREILNKQYRDEISFDVGTTVMVNYNGVKKTIKQSPTSSFEEKIYSKAESFIKGLL